MLGHRHGCCAQPQTLWKLLGVAGFVWRVLDRVLCSLTNSWRSLLTLLLLCVGYWKGAVVAVKVIVHNASMARKVDTLRESLVGISMQHQHVVRLPSVPPCLPRKHFAHACCPSSRAHGLGTQATHAHTLQRLQSTLQGVDQ